MFREYFTESSGFGKIHVSQWIPDNCSPKGILQIVHGIAEHTLRYDAFARFLNEKGFIVVAEDHMGHGKSIGKDGIKGYFHGGWDCAVNDTYRVLTEMQEKYPDIPYILMGHSMGSFMSRTLLIEHPECNLTGCILCGTGWIAAPVLRSGIITAKLICRVYGEKKPNAFLQSIAFNGYNRRVQNQRTDFDWLCRDPRQVDTYVEDPLCGFVATAGLFRDMFGGILFNQKKSNLSKMNKNIPVHFISGECDPVGNYGKGVKTAADAFQNAGMKNVSCRIYPDCRHELLNELNKQDIYEDVAQVLSQYCHTANKSVL